ncbi:MAG: Gfo/Idh/MocA family oxidoreductase [Chloroflexota bacterium]|nr:Gfo/Idh/MocA family oxidoreductase [Chloroflexota bacterium]
MRRRVALIGTGAFAAEHVRAIRAYPERVELVAAVNPNADEGARFCADHAIPTFYPDPSAMLTAERPDMVHIVAPPYTHVDLALACLAAGAHVLCEKPLCGSLADWDRLADAEMRSGRTLSTIFQWRFGAAAQHLKRLIDAGTLGALRVALCETLWYRDADYYAVAWRGQWETAFGGATVGLGIHLMDLLLWLHPHWTHIHAWTATRDRAIDVDNVSLAQVQFADGGVASIINSALSPRQTTHLRLDFQRATVAVNALYRAGNDDWTFTPLDGALSDAWTSADEVRGDGNNAGDGDITAQVGALLDSLDRGARPLVTGGESRRIIEFLTCLYKSARTGTTIARGSIAPDDRYYAALWGGD